MDFVEYLDWLFGVENGCMNIYWYVRGFGGKAVFGGIWKLNWY